MPTNKKYNIKVREDGPYIVTGEVPLVHKTQVVSEYGEPLTWRKDRDIEIQEEYHLCRCGHSTVKPHCDGSHNEFDFDGKENADTGSIHDREEVLRGKHVIVKRDMYLCMNSGFCGTSVTNIDQLIRQTGNTQVRSLLIAMIERCPSGAVSYSIEPGEPDNEPDLPVQIAQTTEITSEGPIEGPLWVTGGIPIERSDGQPFEIRNRVTLCSCGLSQTKPLCDGTHRTRAEEIKCFQHH